MTAALAVAPAVAAGAFAPARSVRRRLPLGLAVPAVSVAAVVATTVRPQSLTRVAAPRR